MNLLKKRSVISFGIFLMCASSFLIFSQSGGATETLDSCLTKIRVGVYDSRAIAVAFGNSKFETQPAELIEEHKKAERAKDYKRIEELKVMGEQHQKRLHRQAFGKEPVDDLLECISDKFPEIMKEAKIDLIASKVICHNEGVETVDITDILVKQYNPSEKTLKSITELLKHKPLDIIE